MLTTLWPTKNGQPNEVDADKELERALIEKNPKAMICRSQRVIVVRL